MTNEIDGFGYFHNDMLLMVGDGSIELGAKLVGTTGGGSFSGKSWAQQMEESYQLQLALALRLPSKATCVKDPNFLEPVFDESAL